MTAGIADRASPLSDIDQARIRRILEAAGFPPNEVKWMVASCPDVETAERFYGGGRSLFVDEESR